ncbi:hypothetical protein [Sulfurimonas sp.]
MRGFQISKKAAIAALLTLGAVASQAATTMPTPDYTDIESAAAIGFGIVLTVGLLMKAKRFFR